MEAMEGLSTGNDVSNSQTVGSESLSNHNVSEKVFKQSEVNDIVKRVKNEAIESFKRMSQEQPDYLHNKLYNGSVSNNVNQNLTTEDVKKIAAEETQRSRDEWMQQAARTQHQNEAQRIANEFFTKLSTEIDKYPELNKQMEQLDISQYGNAVQLSNMVDNTADVWSYLVNDPFKLDALNTMASHSPKLAYAQIQKLSNSLKENEKAQNTKFPNDPLPQLKPSNNATDNGVMTVSDYRKKYKV